MLVIEMGGGSVTELLVEREKDLYSVCTLKILKSRFPVTLFVLVVFSWE